MEQKMEQKIENQAKIKSAPKDVFMHLLMIITFYLSVIGFIALWFQYINVLFPDKLNYFGRTPFLDGIRWATSVLIVAFPVYLFASWLIAKDFKNNFEKKELKIRKWLLYLTLFVAAITIIIDLITLIYNFYGGDLTTRFALKVLVVLIVAATAFGYYLWELKRKDLSSKKPKIYGWTTSVVIVASIIIGFFIAGSPLFQRQVKFDERRINDLSAIQNEIVNYWKINNSLPQNLDTLNNNITGFVAPKDPKTNTAYEYQITGPLSFNLCATFEIEDNNAHPFATTYDFQQNWNHSKGRACFSRTIDPKLLPKKQ